MTLLVLILAAAACLIARRLGRIARSLEDANLANGVPRSPNFWKRWGEASKAANARRAAEKAARV